MNITCSAKACPVLLSASCVFYEGVNLPYTGINMNDNLQIALQKIDETFNSLFDVNIYVTDGTLTGDRVVSMAGHPLSFNGGNVAIGNTSPLSLLHVGDRNVNNSSNPVILISRNVTSAFTSNTHAFSDSSLLELGTGLAYNSFDARVDIGGSNNIDHYAGFQHGININRTGNITNIYGLFTNTTISAGSVTNNYSVYAYNPTGAGTITNNFGLYVANLSKGSSNYGVYLDVASGANKWNIYANGSADNYFNGSVGIGIIPSTYKLDVSGTFRTSGVNTLSNLSGVGNRMVIADASGILSTQAILTLTTTGSSGASTLISNVLNVPTYTLSGLGGVPSTRTLTINGTGYDLSADRSWSVGTVTSVNMSVPTGFAISGNPVTTSGTLALGFASGYSLPTNASQTNWNTAYNWVNSFPALVAGQYLTNNGTSLSWAAIDLSGYVPITRTLTINGTSYDLSANRTWSVGTVTSIATTGPITGGTITGSGTIGITQATTSTDGYLSSTDWNTFNNKYNLPSLTSGSVLFSNGTTIAQDNSNFFWDNTNKRLGIGSSTFFNVTNGWGGTGLEQKSFLISSASNKYTALVIAGGGSGTGGGAIQFVNYTGTPIADFGTADGTEIGFAARQNTANINFYTTPTGTSPVKRLSIFAGGNVLIQNGGTFTDSGQRLQVQGDALVSTKLYVGTSAPTAAIINARQVDDSYATNVMQLTNGNGTFNVSIAGDQARISGTNRIQVATNLNFLSNIGIICSNNLAFTPNSILAIRLAENNDVTGTRTSAITLGSSALNSIQSTTILNAYTSWRIGLSVSYTARLNGQSAALGMIGSYFNNTMTAPANNSYLYGMVINPVFEDNTFTGNTKIAFGIQNNTGWSIYQSGVSSTNFIEGDTAIGTTTLGTATKLTIGGSETASSAIARGTLINTTLVAAANNDVLVGLDVNPTFTNGAFTGVSNIALRVQGNQTWGTSTTNPTINFAASANASTANFIINNPSFGGTLLTFRNATDTRYVRISGANFDLTSSGTISGNILTSGNTSINNTQITGFNQALIEMNGDAMVIRNRNNTGATMTFLCGDGDILFQQRPASVTVTRAKFAQTTGNFMIQNGGTFTDSGERFQLIGDAKITGTMYLNSASDALFNFQNAGANKWRIGNAYVAGANYFQLYDSVNSLERIRWNNNSTATFTSDFTFVGGSNNVATFQATQPNVKIQATGASNGAALVLSPSNSGINGSIQNGTGGGLDFYVGASPSIYQTIKSTGQLQLQAYTTTSSFSGTVAGYLAFDSSGNIITTAGGAGGGSVTTVSVVSANGFAGTVANPTTTPAITISTTITGLLKGNGTAISAASAGTDYQAPITLTTTGTSGPATLIGNTLNIPQYTGGGGGTNIYNSDGTLTANRVMSAGGFTLSIEPITTFTTAVGLTRSANNLVSININNTNSGASSSAGYAVSSDASAGFATLYKYSSTNSSAGTGAGPSDFMIDNATAGNIVLRNSTSSGDIRFVTSAGVGMLLNSAGKVLIGTTSAGGSKVRISGLPTSSAGLSSGDIWNNGGVLNIVP